MEQQRIKTKYNRIHRSEAEIVELLAEYEATKTDWTISEFCELNELSESTFYYWQKKYSHRQDTDLPDPPAGKGSFIQLTGVPDLAGPATADVFVSLRLASGHELFIHQYVEAGYLKALLGMGGDR